MIIEFVAQASNLAFASKARGVKLLGIDFDGVMTDNMVYVFEDGREAVRCSRLEGYGLRHLIKAGVTPVIISTEENPVVSARAKKLNVACLQNVPDKVAAMQKLLDERGLGWEQAAFLGNDVNDLDVLAKVALPCIVQDAHEDMHGRKHFVTRRPGGNGAVRELCDAIAMALEQGPA